MHERFKTIHHKEKYTKETQKRINRAYMHATLTPLDCCMTVTAYVKSQSLEEQF